MIQVAVPVPGIPGALTYGVPAALAERARAGVRVRVPVGGRKVIGLCLGPAAERPSELRLVEDVLDDEPVVTEAQIAVVRFVAAYYLAPLGECLRLVLPPDTARDLERRYRLTEQGAKAGVFGAAMGLSAGEVRFLEGLELDVAKTPRQLKATRARLDKLVEKGVLDVAEERGAGAVRVDERIIVLEGGQALPGRAFALGALDAWLRTLEAPPRVSEAQALFPSVRGKLQRLVTLGRVRLDGEVREAPGGHGLAPRRPAETLNAEQEAAVGAISARLDDGAAFLLDGVTGSGKTEVYLEVLRRVLARGRGAILVVPEIALTPQLLGRVQGALADVGLASEVGMLHSGLSVAERRDTLARLRRGEARVALGARSALFAPVQDLGLVVVDEEHEPSLKQEETPRYHGRDVALWRARAEHAVCVLGSATPSLESRHNVELGKLVRLELPQRVGGGGSLPTVEVIDLRSRGQINQARKLDRAESEGTGVVLSRPLRDALSQTLETGEQALLFLNRRGYSSFLLCDACGHVEECPHCSVSLTWHRRRDRLVCHQCDHERKVPGACPACQAGPLTPLGIGTERVETEVRTLFPSARTLRIDRDTTRRKGSLVKALRAVAAHEVDVVIGTQMVAKGHDFPRIALVGVVMADVALSVPDFRASERAFSLLTQVAGRAGRGERPGRVLVQTFQPEHPALRFAREHDVAGFAERELVFREEARYPPYWRVGLIRVEGEDPTAVDARARQAGELMRTFGRAHLEAGGWDVLGPAPAGIERLRGRTRHQLFVRTRRSEDRARLLAVVAQDEAFTKGLSRSRCRLVLDVDPISML